MDLVYVSGFGRSGSSVFDMFLSKQLNAVSAGELCNLFSWAATGRACSCGVPVELCDFWGPVVSAVSSDTGQTYTELRVASEQAELHGGSTDTWRYIWASTFSHLKRIHEVSLIVDSSKTAGHRRRLTLLGTLEEIESLHSVQLVRSLKGTIASLRKGGNKALEDRQPSAISAPAIKGAVGWLLANWSARRQARVADSDIVLRYEDLILRPSDVLGGLYKRLPHFESISNTTHQIAGNRALRSVSTPTLRADPVHERLPIALRLFAAAVEHVATASGITPRSTVA